MKTNQQIIKETKDQLNDNPYRYQLNSFGLPDQNYNNLSIALAQLAKHSLGSPNLVFKLNRFKNNTKEGYWYFDIHSRQSNFVEID